MASWKGAAWVKAASDKANAVNRQRAAQFAADVLPIIRDIEGSGVVGYSAIARELNARGIHSARGGVWHATVVRNIMTGSQVATPNGHLTKPRAEPAALNGDGLSIVLCTP
jgi:hypothetical protein